MMEFNNHGNRISIKGIQEDAYSEKFFFKLMNDLVSEMGSILLCAERVNYSLPRLESNEEYPPEFVILPMHSEPERMLISMYSNLLSNEVLGFLFDVLFAYEHVYFYFYNRSDKSVMEEYFSMPKDWRSVSEKYSIYCLYKGVEEDVLWLGKSPNLNFPSLDQ